MKEAKEYLKNVTCLTLKGGLYEIGKQMQKDAYNQAIDDAAENALVEFDEDGVTKFVDKQSILKLKI